MHADSMNITLDNVNVTVLFESDGSPLVIVDIKVLAILAFMPWYNSIGDICSFHRVSVAISM